MSFKKSIRTALVLAMLLIAGSIQAQTVKVNVKDAEGGIDETKANSQETTDNSIYDLQGRKIKSQTKKGINIINKKKVVVN